MSQPPVLPPKPIEAQVDGPSIPDSWLSLPTAELEKLVQSISEIRGFLVKDVDLSSTVKELSGVIDQMKQYIQQLESLDGSKQVQNEKLKNLESLNSQWQSLQTEMLQLLDQKFSIDTLYNTLFQLLNESKQTSESLSNSFINAPEPHADSSIESFISNYKKERSLYHLRTAKLQRFKENRIGGLYL